MRRLLSTMLLLLFAICSAFSADLSEFQKKAYEEISIFLKEEGFSPSIDSDGTLLFKKEGALHWIYVNKNQLFISVNRGGFKIGGEDGYKYDKSVYAANKVNKDLSVVKVYCTESSAKVSYELYAKSIEDFKYIFYKSIELLDFARNAFIEAYQSEDLSVEKNDFLPIYGIDFNTTKNELDNMGYKERKIEDDGVTRYIFENVWVDYKEGKVSRIILGSSDVLPQNLVKLGFNEPKSYNEWVKFVENMGFTGIDYNDKKIDSDNYMNASIAGQNKELNLRIYISITGFNLPNYTTKVQERPYMNFQLIE